MRREKVCHFVVVEGQSRGAEPLGVGRQVDPSRRDAGVELGGAVAPVAQARQDGVQVGKEKDIEAGIGGKRLVKPQVARLPPEIPFLE